MADTPKQELIDQALHAAAAIVALAPVLMNPNAIGGALSGFAIGVVREVSQHGTYDIRTFGRGPWTDIAFWALGGALATILF